ncbi:glycosyltransferase [Nakamurella sp. YIM 132087]|uniref:Glycosyltransferase n=1 Tax=Nakamurella alba TaxID=2665158 RepID=A0A7K1FJ70_9ACTN|nr:glycosyltransferase family 1 protein [Nakamurella alba]MTD14116.1 glycosyltransferase [Nakamurella alba]
MPVVSVLAEQVLAPVPGGTGRYTRALLEHLPAAAPVGWSVRAVTAFHRDTAAARVPGVRGPRRLPVGHRVLNRLWERGLPPSVAGDVVHATTPLAPARHRGPLVVTVHDAVPWTHPETLTPRGVSWHRTMIGRAADRAAAVIVPTAAVAEELSGVLPGIAGRLRVVHMGATRLPAPPDAAARRAALRLPEKYLISLATLEPRKGLDVLLAALAKPESGDAALVVVGQSGWGDVDPVRLAARSGVRADRVHLLGRIPDEDLAAVLAGARALVMPSRAEGFGLPVIEAMAAGVPALHSDIPALVEVAGGAGIPVPVGSIGALADAVREIWTDDALAADRSAAGLARAADFGWDRTARATWEVYTSC